ncbi:MAG: dipeptide/oligopeptide/nickel ABC transporter ATP-binding protein [Clostridiales bacterium]|jgi:ABC-type oligopeptide transport system ATPase subunit|nr:dipeptide/oligopeptide/nickel ABC transporter ATP-binding protein [Eubacteriales bacterium]MDH7566187.1 dipeptide/oligopeptide/nickel ABC transporter ATP-binding protein [Clostridiales bacterium]
MLMEVVELKKNYLSNLSLMRKNTAVVKAVDGVSFSVGRDEVVGIVGESGCGKSTLARQLVRLEVPTAGKIYFEGEDISLLKGTSLKNYIRSCQIIFQDSLSSLNPSLKIGDILKEPLVNHFKLSKQEIHRRIAYMLEKVKLGAGVLERFPQTLSGGELQRVNICRALLLTPRLLICDEIISSLDVSIQASILNLMKELKKEFGMSLIFISHDINVVRFISDRILVMKRGRIVEEIDNKNREYQVRHPYTKKLFQSLPVSHPDKRVV